MLATMANDQTECNELLKHGGHPTNTTKHGHNKIASKDGVFSLTFNPVIIEQQNERSTSRSSSSSSSSTDSSSFIDPGEDKPEESGLTRSTSTMILDGSPKKRLCNEYNRRKIRYDHHNHHHNHSRLLSKDSSNNNNNNVNINDNSNNSQDEDEDHHSEGSSSNQQQQDDDKCKPFRSFLIKDILSPNHSNNVNDNDNDNHGNNNNKMDTPTPRGFIRPWDSNEISATANSYLQQQLNMASTFIQTLQYNAALNGAAGGVGLHPNHLALLHNSYHGALNNYHLHNHNHLHHARLMPNRRPRSADDDSRSERSESDSPESPVSSTAATNSGTGGGGGGGGGVSSPLDALFEMTSKAFDRNENNDKSSDPSSDHLNLFNNRNQQIKKKRKSRTAFTNHQIFELEKRFLYQKYLSPADRDEIAQSLGLTNAQVITWFQNRRAKLKRDVEELKKDVDAAKLNGVPPSILENIQDLNLLKKTDLVAALHHQHVQHHQANIQNATSAL